jgi:hypothetical protein
MPRRPHVVVAEIGDVRSAGEADAFVVRERLAAMITIQVLPADRVAKVELSTLPVASEQPSPITMISNSGYL